MEVYKCIVDGKCVINGRDYMKNMRPIFKGLILIVMTVVLIISIGVFMINQQFILTATMIMALLYWAFYLMVFLTDGRGF